MIALLARAQALGTALSGKDEGVSLSTETEPCYFGGDTRTVYRAAIAGYREAEPSYGAALAALMDSLTTAAMRVSGSLAIALGEREHGSVQGECFLLLTLIADDIDCTIRVERKSWPIEAPFCFYTVCAEGLYRGSWADHDLGKAWGMALDGLRAMARAKHERLTAALAADDKAARS